MFLSSSIIHTWMNESNNIKQQETDMKNNIIYLKSQILTVPSSDPEYIHFPSHWNPTAITLLVCES